MKKQAQNWIWFLLIMGVVLGLGIYLGNSRRRELGKSFDYSLDDYRKVDESLIGYREMDPVSVAVENPSALAVNEHGRIYVGGENAIEMIDGEKIVVEGTPLCLAVDESGALYAGMTNRIEVISRDGSRSEIPIPSSRAYITSLAVHDQFVFAADAGSRKIWRFNRDGGEPFEIGQEDSPEKRGFYVPSPFFDIDIGTGGTLWAVNPGYHAFEAYSTDGAFLTRWENSSMGIDGFSGCCNPAHFALLPDGAFVTAEKGLPRIKVHNPDGTLRSVVAPPDRFEGEAGVADLVVDSRGRILVLDPAVGQIRIFEVKP